MGSTPFALVFALVMLLLIVVGLYQYFSSQERRDELTGLAARHGWTYTTRDDSWTTRFEGDPFGHGFDRRATNVLSGAYDGRPSVVFDYRYSTQGDGDESPGDPTSVPLDHPWSVVALDAGAALPLLAVTPEDVVTRFVGRITDRDIELESEDFNRAFTVTCPDRKFASDVLHPQMMQLLLEHRDLCWRFQGRHLLAVRDGKRTTAQIESTLETLGSILDQVPAFVLADRRGRPGESAGT
jgi:hypothetical protein